MPYNLLVDPFAPFRMQSGAVRWLRLVDIVAELPDGDYAVEPQWPRADLNIATYELLIGILSVALPPKTHDEWRARWKTPPLRR